ncbi:MAG TPA: hypothetical protein VFY22_12845, partial [Hydrogenophaga sp.]|nr:hypothetical protein [Hydrogenophaga sp.]
AEREQRRHDESEPIEVIELTVNGASESEDAALPAQLHNRLESVARNGASFSLVHEVRRELLEIRELLRHQV